MHGLALPAFSHLSSPPPHLRERPRCVVVVHRGRERAWCRVIPLEVAELIERSGSEVRRDPATGLYVLDATVPPTLLTLAEYERGLRVLHLRERATIVHAERAG